MHPSARRATRIVRWVVPVVTTATLMVGFAAPSLLHAQIVSGTKQHVPTGAVTAPANQQNHPSPPASNSVSSAPQVGISSPVPAASDALQLGRAFTEVAERVLPSVVSIHVEAEADTDGWPFFFPFMSPYGHEVPRVRGSGSGVIIREDGVILTNNHVVERARRLTVRLRDGRTFRGRILGTDPATDLALVKIDATGLPAARLGDSDQARVGEWVLAIGAPLGLEATVTHGVISATGRGGLGANEIEDYLQTDASINPGNSGGPLVNLRGEVLGINTMIIGRNTGIGMAVPSRLAQSVVQQILRNGRVSRGWIGVGVQDLTSDLARTMGLGNTRGALINQVEPGTPAARGGIQVGDVVTAIDGSAVTCAHDLVRSITRRGVGEQVNLTVLRNGRTHTVTVTTAERPGSQQASIGPYQEPPAPAGRQGYRGLGLRLATLGPDAATRLGVPPGSVVVAGVEPGSPADEAGLRRGDVILRADGQEVRSIADVQSAAQDQRVALLVRRGRAQVFVPLVGD